MSSIANLVKQLRTAAKAFLARFDIAVTRHSTLQTLYERSTLLDKNAQALHDIRFLQAVPRAQVAPLLKYLTKSRSQIRQDLFVLSETGFKTGGFFVEFGATNGMNLSNSYLLEKEFGWSGIVAEPARCWRNDLIKNRTCHVETRCVWRNSNDVLTFNEVANADMSTIDQFTEHDSHRHARRQGKVYEVETISLLDMLDKYHAPTHIDYLSIDTEGSEYEILSHFDFARYKFDIITCEHNFTPMRDAIHKLLGSQGYVRKYEDVSQFDDWFVKA